MFKCLGGAAVGVAVQTALRVSRQCTTSRGREGACWFPGLSRHLGKMPAPVGSGRLVLRPTAGGYDPNETGVPKRARSKLTAEDRH